MITRFGVIILALVLFTTPLAAGAQQAAAKVYRIGFLSPSSPSAFSEQFRRRLSQLGYMEGQNVHIEFRWAEGKAERLPELAADLVRTRVDIIVATVSTAAKAAQQATSTIPIVMVTVGDPVGLGLVASLARPGGNVTGLTSFGPELDAKRMELLKELLPRLTRAAVLWTPTNPLHEVSLRNLHVPARVVGVELLPLKVSTLSEIESAVRAAGQERAGALIVYSDGGLINIHSRRIAALAVENRLPTLYGLGRPAVEAGGLIGYAPNFTHNITRAADYVDRILKGARASDLPVEEPSRFELAINLKTARALGLTIPQSILLRADQIIE